MVDVTAAQYSQVIRQQLKWEGDQEGLDGTGITRSAFAPISSSPSVATAITIPSRALISSTLLLIFSYVAPRGTMATTGMRASMRAMGPCFISPAGYPSAWM